MCGIIGGAGPGIVELVLGRLSEMQYRGYDSWGIATVKNGVLVTEKYIGAISKTSKDHGEMCIGHTRWATHGMVSLNNTHPITCENIAVVHNGIIENHGELKALCPDFTWTSDTDTELIIALVRQMLPAGDASAKNQEVPHLTIDTLEEVLMKIKGDSAFLMLDTLQEKIFFGRKGATPLFLVLGDTLYLTSDISSVSGHVITIKDGQCGSLDAHRFELDNFDIVEVNNSQAAPSKTHETWFETEFRAQPALIEEALTEGVSLPSLENIYLTGCGSAYIACMVGQYFLNKAGIAAFAYHPSQLPDFATTIVAVSQSGETADVLRAMQGRKTIGILNNTHSSIAQRSYWVIPIHAGKEISVASTKSTACQMLVFARWALLAGLQSDLVEIPRAMRRVDLAKIDLVADSLAEYKHILVIGNGSLYPIALECALKVKELAYIHAEGMQASELKHGPLALVQSKVAVLCLGDCGSAPMEVQARGGLTFSFDMPEYNEVVAPFVYLAAVQWLAYRLCKLKGNNVDMPRNLAKSVTVS